jgi:hypothetical protein
LFLINQHLSFIPSRRLDYLVAKAEEMNDGSESSSSVEEAAAAVAATVDNDKPLPKPTREEIELWEEISKLIDRNERSE